MIISWLLCAIILLLVILYIIHHQTLMHHQAQLDEAFEKASQDQDF